jgi:hypothetical protein
MMEMMERSKGMRFLLIQSRTQMIGIWTTTVPRPRQPPELWEL